MNAPKCPARNPITHGYNSVFNQITQSPETLAEKLVYYLRYGNSYTSSILGDVFKSRAEAIAATVAKLKEVCDAKGD